MKKAKVPQEPTHKQCEENEPIKFGNRSGFACYYPQIGGYVGKCVVLKDQTEGDSCFDVFVWHDGEFPFGENTKPKELHHCSPNQFIEFGKLVSRLGKAR